MSIQALAEQVEFAQKGNQKAFSELVKATQNATTAIALSIVKDIDASEDVAQQAYIKVWQQLPTLKNNQSFLPWLRQITRYTAFNYIRDNKTQERVSGDQSDAIIDALESDLVEGEQSLGQAQLKLELANFVEALPDESRELILLYYREEQSTQQVASLLELSEVNVRQKLSRARKQLKAEWLAKHGKLVLSTAPGLGFTVLIANLVSATSPVAAATVSASVSASQTGLLGKFAALLGGAMAGAGIAILAVFFSTKLLLANITNTTFRPKILRIRNGMFAWILVFGFLLTLSYELTDGWWAPLVCYVLFSIGLVRLVETMQLLSAHAGLKKQGKWCIAPSDNTWRRKLLNWAGPILGGIGLISGLMGSGRLVI
jgi:RNA polymerase sigma factor (sigma-70 family)